MSQVRFNIVNERGLYKDGQFLVYILELDVEAVDPWYALKMKDAECIRIARYNKYL